MNRVNVSIRGSREISTDRITYVITRCDGGTKSNKCIITCGNNGNSGSISNIKM